MAFLQVCFFSNVLGKQVGMNVILPQTAEDDIPVLYLLHGMSDDHTIWSRRTAVERYADEAGLAVIMPDGDLSWYTDMHGGAGRYFTFMAKELPSVCHAFFRQLSEKREKTFAAGLSMGGYGAFKLALNRPEQYACAASLSGALNPATMYQSVRAPYAEMLFGDRETCFDGSENDLYAVSTRLAEKDGPKPRLYQWCGTEDGLLETNRRMRDHLKTLGFDLAYSESEGNHSWPWWDARIRDVINWLPLKRV